MNDKLQKKLIVLCETLIILAPFLIIAFFTYPVGDDYNYGQETYRVWVLEQNHSFSSIIYLIKHAVSVTYHNWLYNRGEYISFIFSCLMPSGFGNHTTWMNAWILIGISTVAIFQIVNVVFNKWIKIEYKYVCLCFAVVLFYIVSYMPSISQGYYWFNGAFYNLFITSVGIIYMADCVFMVLSEARISIKRQLGIIVLAWFIGGGNYASILVWGIILVLLLMYILYDTHKMSKSWLRYFVPFCIFAGINLFAPCNLNRVMETERTYLETIRDSLIAVPKVYGTWIFETPLILVLLITGIIAWNNMDIQVEPRRKVHPVFLVVLTYLLAAAMICPVLYAQGIFGKGRVENVYYMVFISLVMFDWIYTLRYIKLYSGNGKYKYSKIKWGKQISVLLGVVLLVATVWWPSTSNTRLAYDNLIDGRVFRYRDIMEERLRIYADHQGEDVIVPRTEEDYSLYLYYDLKDDQDEWINCVVAQYYGVGVIKKSVSQESGQPK